METKKVLGENIFAIRSIHNSTVRVRGDYIDILDDGTLQVMVEEDGDHFPVAAVKNWNFYFNIENIIDVNSSDIPPPEKH